jgi:adenylate kinase family enzyme
VNLYARYFPRAVHGSVQGVEQLLCDMVFHRSNIPGHSLLFSDGLVQNIAQVKAEYIATRNLQPVRLLIQGPPASGKSMLADELGQRYSIPVYRALDLIALVKYSSAEWARELEASLSGKDGGRLSSSQMALLCRAALDCVQVRNRGFVLDGFPKTLREAREVFTDPGSSEQQESEVAAAHSKPGEKKSGKGTGKAATASVSSLPDDMPNILSRRLRIDLIPEALVRTAHLIVNYVFDMDANIGLST